ncbi:glycogen/starch/alpha-glucan phosphorylase, partial [Bacillus sp. HC-Mk]
NESYRSGEQKQMYYLSIEFLLGRLLGSNILNLGIRDVCEQGLSELGISLQELEEVEADAGLGNGGLGRLAACFLDSLASLNLPGHGCGIRYKHGLFDQKIVDGYQVEFPEQWLLHENVWEVRRYDQAVEVSYFGSVDRDKLFRTLGLRRAAEASVSQYNGEAKDALQSFADGVNAFIREAKEEKKLPVEFTILGYEPAEWSIVDTLTIGK